MEVVDGQILSLKKLDTVKIIKIIFGFLLLYGAGKEYVHASKQLGSFFSPGIIVAIIGMLILSTWLIGSGLSQRKFSIKSFEAIKFFIISLVTFSFVAFFTLASYVVPDDFMSINGVNIPMNKCINGSERIIEDEAERKEYCLCLAEKITSDSFLKDKYRDELKKGKLGDIFIELQKEEKFVELGLEDCYGKIEITWTDNVASTLKSNWIDELQGTDFAQTNDVEIYCECLLSEYRKHPLSKIMEENFQESDLGIVIENQCIEKSRK